MKLQPNLKRTRTLDACLSVADLAPFTGQDGRPIYLAADGIVFNMSSHEGGAAFYGPGGPYNVFAGRCVVRGTCFPTAPSRTDIGVVDFFLTLAALGGAAIVSPVNATKTVRLNVLAHLRVCYL